MGSQILGLYFCSREKTCIFVGILQVSHLLRVRVFCKVICQVARRHRSIYARASGNAQHQRTHGKHDLKAAVGDKRVTTPLHPPGQLSPLTSTSYLSVLLLNDLTCHLQRVSASSQLKPQRHQISLPRIANVNCERVKLRRASCTSTEVVGRRTSRFVVTGLASG
jgi:hypothetical protein